MFASSTARYTELHAVLIMCQMSVVSEMISEEDIEAMKGELSRIQEYLMEAPESERRVLKAKAKEVKK